MSDVSQGPGWWQASDGKWYPPEQAPGAQQTAAPQGPAASQGFPPQGQAQGGFGAPMGAPAMAGVGPGGQPLADWGTRVLGALIDFVAPWIICAIVFAISDVLGIILWIVSLVWVFYMAYLNGQTGQSIGKKVAGTKVIKADTGELIGGGMGIVRYIAHIADSFICYIGWLFPLWDAKRQTLADKIVGTVVISGLPKQKLDGDIFKN